MAILARDIRDRCKGRVDAQVLYCLEALAESHGVLRQQVIELALLLDGMSTIITDFTHVASNMKTAIERMQHMEHPDDGPAVTE